LSVTPYPEPETAVAFARALAAFAAKQQCSLFLCRAEDAPVLHILLHLVTATLACMESVPNMPAIFCAEDDVLPLSAARMPAIPLPGKQNGNGCLRVVFLRRGNIPAAAIFDDLGLYPTRKEERILDTCFADALSAQYRPQVSEQHPISTELRPIHRIRTTDLTDVYLTRYARGTLSAVGTVLFSFSSGSSPQERLLARLLCSMGGEETVSAPIHFSIREPWEDCGDILCPLSVTDMRRIPVREQSGGITHWALLSQLTERYQHQRFPEHFPTPRNPDALSARQPLSIPVCAPMELGAEFRYSHAPALSDSGTEEDIPRLSRRYAAMEAEDAILLARDIALLLSVDQHALAAWTQPSRTSPRSIPLCRCHGYAVSDSHTGRPLTLTANLSRLTRGGTSAIFRPAVEGIVHRSDDGMVRIVATRDHNFRIIADAYTTEAAEALFHFAKDRLLGEVISASNA
jgi:hypothetical protein